jgi:large subunit ribosomal protein L10
MATKEATVAELTDHFRNSTAIVLTEYRGLSVAALKKLRRGIATDATYAVVKNTLTRIAAKEAGIDAFDGLLVGPSALAFIHGDAVSVAKSLRDFAKENPQLVIKGGYFDGAPISSEDVMRLANLETREVLLAKLAGAFKASLFGAAYMFNAPLAQAARTVDALRQKQESAG